jgi:hypothetical protein
MELWPEVTEHPAWASTPQAINAETISLCMANLVVSLSVFDRSKVLAHDGNPQARAHRLPR